MEWSPSFVGRLPVRLRSTSSASSRMLLVESRSLRRSFASSDVSERNGESLARCRMSSLYPRPMPATRRWSRSMVFSCPPSVPFVINSANSSEDGSGPSFASGPSSPSASTHQPLTHPFGQGLDLGDLRHVRSLKFPNQAIPQPGRYCIMAPSAIRPQLRLADHAVNGFHERAQAERPAEFRVNGNEQQLP